MFLDSIALVRTTSCLAEPGKIIITGKPARSLAEVIPYLAALPDVIAYNPETLSLTFRRRTGFLTLYPDRIYITKVKNVDEGIELLVALTGAINATWEHRQELVAAHTGRRAPRPLDIYVQLPQTNCGQCGEATCMAFAVGLLMQKHVLDDCPVMKSDFAFAERRATLDAML
jgi:ArsR family metal-binding transcriptional regulator